MPKRLARAAALLVVLFVLSHASFRGVLFPWSPVRPGYAATAFPGGTIVYPARGGLPAAYRDAGALLDEVERANRLAFRKDVTVVVAGDWGLFVRGSLLGWKGRPLPVLGSALQTGTVVYLSPLAREPGRDMAGVLKHELTHALMFQRMPLRRTFELVRLDWFEEGLAVRAGNPGDYFDDAAFARWAAHPGYRFGPWGDPELERLPEALRGVFRLTEYRVFIDFLVDRYGEDRFFAFRDRVLADPARHEAAFAGVLGTRFADAVAAFEAAVRAGAWPRVP
ncbi:MAG TPA: hypothetical protein VHG91_04060 [Longimicrobium sp.]|nr:hypothetical protein [Longimicrobium sp.]